MLALETVYHFLATLRELSVMFSPWWSRSRDMQQEGGAQTERLLQSEKKSASFRLSTCATPDVSELKTTKVSKKKSKHKRSKSKRRSIEAIDGVGEVIKPNKSQRNSGSLSSESSNQGKGRNLSKKKESCRVINLKIPLPDNASVLLSRYYYHNPYKDYPQPKIDTAVAAKSQEELTNGRKRTKRKEASKTSEAAGEQPTTLKSVELVSFVTEEQIMGDMYTQHQRSTRPLSSSVMTPSPSSASKYSSLLTLNERTAATATPSHHSQPCFTAHSTNLRKSYPTGIDSPEHSPKSQHSLHPSHRSIQDYLFKPVFRFSHRTGTPGMNSSYPLTSCGCGDNSCRLCLANVRMVHPAPLTLDGFKHPPTGLNFNRSRRGSLDSCCRLGVALPPLKPPQLPTELDDSYGELHALGHSVTKYPPKAVDKKNGKMSLASTSTKSAREPPVPSYLDALTNGPPGYHRRLSQMAILVSETVRWEREKPKSKSKKSCKGSQGSL